MLKISVAMTTCNGQDYVEQQLLSLMKQMRCPDEVVISDDCSDDSTVRIIEDFIENNSLNWRLIKNEERLGFKQNFRRAIENTTGDVVFLCDQDDIWCEDKLESISGIFAAHNDVCAVNSSFTVIDGSGAETSQTDKRGNNNYGMIDHILKRPFERIGLRTVFHRNISPGCTSAMSRAVADAYVQSTDCVLPHDYEINIMAAAKKGLYFYNVPLIKYRIHGNNTIGLAVKKQSRTEIATEKLKVASVIGSERLIRLCGRRLKALENISFFGVLSLWFSPDYYLYFPFRERVGDILYVFGRR